MTLMQKFLMIGFNDSEYMNVNDPSSKWLSNNLTPNRNCVERRKLQVIKDNKELEKLVQSGNIFFTLFDFSCSV